MQRERAPGRQRLAQLLEELAGVERGRRPHRVIQIQRGEVELLLRVADELHPVLDQHAQLRIAEHAVVHRLEVLFRHVDDVGVDLDHRHLLDRGMLERLLGGAAVAAADDQHAPGRGVSGESRMHQVLVIDELLLLGGHVEPV